MSFSGSLCFSNKGFYRGGGLRLTFADTTSYSGGGGGSSSYLVAPFLFSEGRVFLGLLLWWCFVDLNCGVVAATTCNVPLLPFAATRAPATLVGVTSFISLSSFRVSLFSLLLLYAPLSLACAAPSRSTVSSLSLLLFFSFKSRRQPQKHSAFLLSFSSFLDKGGGDYINTNLDINMWMKITEIKSEEREREGEREKRCRPELQRSI